MIYVVVGRQVVVLEDFVMNPIVASLTPIQYTDFHLVDSRWDDHTPRQSSIGCPFQLRQQGRKMDFAAVVRAVKGQRKAWDIW